MSAGAKRTVLITRPEADAAGLCAACDHIGLTPVMCPMLSMTHAPENVPDLSQAGTLILTSQQAVRAIVMAGAVVADVPVYTVGAQTAAAARDAGFVTVHAADGTAEKLMEKLADAALAAPVLYLSGREISKTITVPGLDVERHIVYAAEKTDGLTAAAVNALRDQQVAAVILMSARTGAAFAESVVAAGLTGALAVTKALCLSDSVLQSVANLPWQGAEVAAYPDMEHMTALLDKLSF